MRKTRTVLAIALLSALIIVAVPIPGVKALTLIWQADVSSKGTPVTSPVLELGREYTIVAMGAFASYDLSGLYNFAADAQNYTPYPSDWWVWDAGNVFPAPDGHSFLQIDGMDVNWGQFSNGAYGPVGEYIGHEYTITYVGLGAPITFAIVDWIDGDYNLNTCFIRVRIYEGPLVAFGETAFAYGDDYATCFRCFDFDMDGKRDFKSWGWSNGPLGPNYYEFEIWAGAAKCNLAKGTLVGTLTVDYDGSTAIVAYMMDAGWTMGFAQLYVDGDPLPRGDGDYTVAPGRYPYKYYVDGPTHTFTVTGLSGDIYVVAHTDVFPV